MIGEAATPGEAVAQAARLRPDNRVVLEYEPLAPDASSDSSPDRDQQEGAGR